MRRNTTLRRALPSNATERDANGGVPFIPCGRRELNTLVGLHPDLVPYVTPFGSTSMRWINAPLVQMNGIDLPFPVDHPSGCSSWVDLANLCLATKREMIATAIKDHDWHTYIFAHERPYRFEAIQDILKNGYAVIDDLWPVIGDAWIDSNNIHEFSDEWLELWRTPSRRKWRVMSKEDRAVWRSLPDELTIYRGVSCEDEDDALDAVSYGLSWTLDLDRAIWFARRFAGEKRAPYVAKTTINKRQCFAYFGGRDEQEIVIDYVGFHDWSWIEIPAEMKVAA